MFAQWVAMKMRLGGCDPPSSAGLTTALQEWRMMRERRPMMSRVKKSWWESIEMEGDFDDLADGDGVS